MCQAKDRQNKSACQKQIKNTTVIVTSGISAWGFHYKWPAKSELVNIEVHFGGKTDAEKDT